MAGIKKTAKTDGQRQAFVGSAARIVGWPPVCGRQPADAYRYLPRRRMPLSTFCDCQDGQTLIETLVAVFMLVMGVSASLGLAIYALNASGNVAKQIIAAGLAREGLEAVKDMRDTNWLQQTAMDTGCFNYITLDQTASCYKDWLGDDPLTAKFYCLNPSNGRSCNGRKNTDSYFLTVDQTNSDTGYWKLNSDNSNFGLLYDPADAGQKGFYYSPNSGAACDNSAGTSDYCRKVVLTLDYTAPYNHPEPPGPASYDASDIGPELKIQSEVWWVDQKCARVPDFSQASPACRIEIDGNLTNWKNYQP